MISKTPSLILALVAISVIMFMPTTAFGEESTVEWNLIYVSNNDCHTIEIQKAQMYSGLASKYFELYQLDNVANEVECVSNTDFETYEFNKEQNLTVIIYDELSGKEMLTDNKMDGLFIHGGEVRSMNNFVLVCDCEENRASFEGSTTEWTLSHELSHFVLSYKGYSKIMIHDIVHDIEENYFDCMLKTTDNSCPDFKVKVRADDFPRDFTVMAPYAPAVGDQLSVNIPSEVSDETLEKHLELADLLLKGELDEQEYISHLEQFLTRSLDPEEFDHFLDMPGGYIIPEVHKTKDNSIELDLTPEEFCKISEKFYPIMGQPLEVEEKSHIPSWFKSRAQLWIENRVSDQMYLEGIDHLARMGVVNIL